MNQETLMAGHEIKQAFLRQAIKERVYLIRPKNTSYDQWAKQRKIGFRYAFQDITLEELGREYGGTRENIRGLNRKFLDNMHKHSPPELQAQYPRETIPDRKPLSQRSRERYSEARGGLSLRVRDLVAEGVADPKQIVNTLGISAQSLAAKRITLSQWGIDIPRIQSKEIAKRTENEKDDEKLQEFLDSLSDNQLRGFLRRHSSHETLTTVSLIARELGFWFHSRQVKSIAQILKTAGIPVRPIVRFNKNRKPLGSYYVVYTKHEDRIAEVLRNDPDLQRFR